MEKALSLELISKLAHFTIDVNYLQNRIYNRSTPEPNTGCWLYEGSTGNSGYGKLRIGHNKDFSAHRISFLAFKGEIPAKMCVLHKCDVRICVNPNHLFIGTKQDNSRDMVNKNRHKSMMRLRVQCPQGHPYTGRNSKGARICAKCDKETRKRYYARLKLQRKRKTGDCDS